MKVTFMPISDEELTKKVSEIMQFQVNSEFIKKSGGSLGRAIRMQQQNDIYSEVDKVLIKIGTEDLTNVFNNSEVLYKEKDKISELLEYIIVYLYNTKDIQKLSCIQYVEETKKRLLANSNYDMCIDYLLMQLWEGMRV